MEQHRDERHLVWDITPGAKLPNDTRSGFLTHEIITKLVSYYGAGCLVAEDLGIFTMHGAHNLPKGHLVLANRQAPGLVVDHVKTMKKKDSLRTPVVLISGTAGGTTQAILGQLQAAGVDARVFITAMCRHVRGEVVDDVRLLEAALHQWGHRVVRMAEHLSVVGEQVVMRHKNTTAHGCVIVGEVTCRAIPYRTYDPPMIELASKPNRPSVIRVLAQGDAVETLLEVLCSLSGGTADDEMGSST